MSLLNLESLMNKSLGKNFSEEKNNFEKSIDTLYNSNLSDEDLLLLNDNAFNELVAEDFSVECLTYNTIMCDDILEAASGLLDYKQNQEYLDIYYKIAEVLGTEAVENAVKEQGFFGKIWEGIKSIFRKIIDAFKKMGAAIKRFFTGKSDEEKSEKQEEAYQEAIKLERIDPNASKTFKMKSSDGRKVLYGVFNNPDLGSKNVGTIIMKFKDITNNLKKDLKPILTEQSISNSKIHKEILDGSQYYLIVDKRYESLSNDLKNIFKIKINFKTDKENEIVNKIMYGSPNPKKVNMTLSHLIKQIPSFIFKTDFNYNINRITNILEQITSDFNQFIIEIDSYVNNFFKGAIYKTILASEKGADKARLKLFQKNMIKIIQGLKDISIKIGKFTNAIIKEYIYLKNELTKAYNIALKNKEKYNKKMDKKEAKMEKKAAKQAEKNRIKAMKEEKKAAKQAEKEAKKNK